MPTSAWPGDSEPTTSWPSALSLTRAMKSRTTGSATSASSSAMRTSRSMSCTLLFGDAGLAAHRLDEARQAVGEGGGHAAWRPARGCGTAKVHCRDDSIVAHPAGFPGAWLVALAAVGRLCAGGVPGPRPTAAGCPSALVVGVVLHAVLLVLDIGGLGSDGGGARLGFGPVLSLTVWLVLAVHTARKPARAAARRAPRAGAAGRCRGAAGLGACPASRSR